jgi:hypothetical protein
VAALKFALRPRAMVRAAPIALGVSCTALALLLSLRGEEPVPPRIVRERHQYHQPVPPAFHAATLPAHLPSPPDIPASRHDEAPLPAACVPGRLCATPQRPYTTGGGGRGPAAASFPLLARPPAPLDLMSSSAGRRQVAPAVAPHAPAPDPHTRTPALPSGAAMLRVRAGPGAAPLQMAVVVYGYVE